MSAFDRAYNAVKTVMLSNEKFDRLEEELRALGQDVSSLAYSHAELAQRVARIEGFVEGAAAAGAARQPRIESQ
ncbi:hypothetical protein [Qipengyuania qiaonensis]|uniref:Uncharacterized protein n=1 Tax=Qipengyuania qiaonensis TaxID=2867240 RepID=A0ABS7J508_9SPHN|nr:hypothetical protein [Qipengyuania qiaonensis]MBX7480959.1 hypothetical protein [Qipengyuania qiaonensis]